MSISPDVGRLMLSGCAPRIFAAAAMSVGTIGDEILSIPMTSILTCPPVLSTKPISYCFDSRVVILPPTVTIESCMLLPLSFNFLANWFVMKDKVLPLSQKTFALESLQCILPAASHNVWVSRSV